MSTPEPYETDEALLGRLRLVIDQLDPMPGHLVDGAKALLGLRRLDEELAELVRDSAEERGRLLAVRGEGDVRLISFETGPVTVELRPLVLADVQRLQRAARDDRALMSVLMVQQALVSPAVTLDQVNAMHCGLVEFLVGHVNRISGLRMGRDELDEVVRAPLARACFELARQFGWTPDECAALTVGQILVYLEMLGSSGAAEPLPAQPAEVG